MYFNTCTKGIVNVFNLLMKRHMRTFQIETSVKSAQVYKVSLVTVQTTDRTNDSLPYTLKKCQFYIFLSHAISSTHGFNYNPKEYTAESKCALFYLP